MAYCTPKAADFTAYKDGVELPWNDPVGLACRWNVATAVSDLNLILVDKYDLKRIANACDEHNAKHEIKVAFNKDV